MPDWIPIDQDPPHDTELALWLAPEAGSDMPIGVVIASYKATAMGEQWVEKSITGNINTGLRACLITHYKFLEDGPDGERANPEKTDTIGYAPRMGG